VVLTKITGFRPNFTIFELLAGKVDAIPAFTELTFGSADFGGLRKESAGYSIVISPPIPPKPSKLFTNFLLFTDIIVLYFYEADI
jgi:hypothetical protein